MTQIIPACIMRCTPDKDNRPTNVTYELTGNQTVAKWNKKILTYALIKGTQDIPDQHEIRVGMRLVIQTWQDEIPINFVEVKSNQNPDITFEWVDGNTDPVIQGNTGILGYCNFPDGNNSPVHVHLNDTLNWSFSGTNFQWTPSNTMLHESGHGLGLPHDPNASAVMYYMYNGKLMLDPSDKAAIQNLYGQRTWSAGAYLRMTTAIFNWKLRLK